MVEIEQEEYFLKSIWDEIITTYKKDVSNSEILGKLSENDFHKFLEFYYKCKK